MKLITRFLLDEQGQDIIEYALLGSFVAFGAYVGADTLGSAYNTWFTEMSNAVGRADDGLAAVGAP